MIRWLGVLALVSACCEGRAFAVEKACSPTVASAVRSYLGDRRDTVGAEGYRVASVRQDGLRGRTWVLVERCGQPPVPLTAVAISSGTSLPHEEALRAKPVVHIGDEVSIVARSGFARMELHGWAEESGVVAAKIRVRLPRLSADESQPMPKIVCVVTGAGSAEVTQ